MKTPEEVLKAEITRLLEPLGVRAVDVKNHGQGVYDVCVVQMDLMDRAHQERQTAEVVG